jgi:hypothetical protein
MSLENILSKVFNDIYFIVYVLYYIDQNNDLGIHVKPIHQDGVSNYLVG